MSQNANSKGYEGSASSTQIQEEDGVLAPSQNQDNDKNHTGLEMKTVRKLLFPIIFIVLLTLISLFIFNFLQKIKNNREIMTSIIRNQQKNRQILSEQINTLVQIKQNIQKQRKKNSWKDKDDTNLLEKLQAKLTQFDQKLDLLEKQVGKVDGKTIQKEDVAKLALSEANQIKKQLSNISQNLQKKHPEPRDNTQSNAKATQQLPKINN